MWFFACAPDALAAEAAEITRDRLWYSNAVHFRYNPEGLIDTFRLGWRRRLSTSTSPLLSDSYTLLAGSVVATPAYARLGLYVEAQPIAMVRLFADGGLTNHFGNFDQILSWSDPGASFSDRTREALGEAGENASTRGSYLILGGTLQGKVGPVVLRNTVQLQRLDLALPAGDRWLYDQLSDRLVPDGGFAVLDDLDLLVVGSAIRAGLRYSFSDSLDTGSGTDGSMAYHRAGPLLSWQISDRPPGAGFDQPTLFALAQWWLVHPYRTGAEQPSAVPMVVVGFSFNGDLAGG